MRRTRRPGAGWGLGGDGGFQERVEGVAVRGVAAEDGGEHGVLEKRGDEGGGSGDAEVAAAFAEGGHVADDKAETHAVEARNFGEVEDNFCGGVGGPLDEVFEGGGFGAEDDGAVAVEDVDVVGELGGEVQGHCGLGVV